jgi:hypothetical protein
MSTGSRGLSIWDSLNLTATAIEIPAIAPGTIVNRARLARRTSDTKRFPSTSRTILLRFWGRIHILIKIRRGFFIHKSISRRVAFAPMLRAAT